MKTILAAICIILMTASVALAQPYLVSDPNPSVTSGAVFQIEINDVLQPELYPCESDGSIKLNVGDFHGDITIRARVGNKWPDLDGVFNWSDFSVPFSYGFPAEPASVGNLRLSAE